MQNATAWVSGKFTSSFVQTFRGTSGSTNGVSHHDFFGGTATPAGANARWSFNLQGLESANNAGSDFRIWSYKDDGTYLTNPFSISRALGIVSIPIGLAATTINTNNTTGLLSVYGGASGPNSYRGAEIMFRGGGYSTTPGELTFHTGLGGGGTSQSERMRINAAGNVGIGSAVYYGKLSVYDATNGNASITLQSASNSRFWINESNNILKIGANGGATPPALGVINITSPGFVGIGTGTPQSELSVKGTITAQRVKVTQSGWADYVFHNGYSLPSLQEVAAYIDAHQHLEGIPSAAEVARDGIDIGEMNKKLLAKVEELTLYLIEQNKKITALEEWKLQQEEEKRRIQ